MRLFRRPFVPYPREVAWVHPLFRRYATAITTGPKRALFPYYSALTPGSAPWPLETVIAYMVPMAWYESRGKWWAVNSSSGASGVYQHLPRYWQGRLDSTIRHLNTAGIYEPWQVDAERYDLSGIYIDQTERRPVGILNPNANIAVAAYLYGLQGPWAWSPSRTHWPPEDFAPGLWSWDAKTRTWQRQDRHGNKVD